MPKGWSYSSSLLGQENEEGAIEFEAVPLDVLVDSPVMAGRWGREIPIDTNGDVQLAIFAHDPEGLAATPEQIALHGALVQQADRLFASRHFERYRFLVALSDELGGGGVEHHQSAEIVAKPDYFSAWERNFPKRDVFGHEFTHSWNGKFRRGADSWIPSFERPIRNSLMWMYEGQTQYWGHVLTARSGLWTTSLALDSLAKIAATYDVRPGSHWRDGRHHRGPCDRGPSSPPWSSWQRSEDYYSQGLLMWRAIDTHIRELSSDTCSLDDFARLFFGVDDGGMVTRTYDLTKS